mmetsp:Transcript_36152/g.58011  ORF Transcript_36152/g.58011 Transcript_36152/m.58011 type:complete len:669 (+) Transcript_36152:101-2107(+)
MDDPGSFWAHTEDPGGEIQSSIEKLLSADSPDLEEILNHDETIQECKFFNEPLTDFLSGRDILEKLIRYIIDVPKDALERKAERFPYVASELFACEVTGMLQGVVRDEGLLTLLFSFIKKEGPIDPRHSGYFRKVVGVLVQRNFNDLEEYFRNHTDVLLAFAKKMELFCVMELLIMVAWDVTIDGRRELQWIAQTPLMDTLLEQLDGSKNSSTSAQENTASALIALTETCSVGTDPNEILQQLESKNSTKKMCDLAIQKAHPSSAIASLRVLKAIISRIAANISPNNSQELSNDVPSAIINVTSLVIPYAAKVLSNTESKEAKPLPLQYGTLTPPLGMLRLHLIKLLAELIRIPLDLVKDVFIKNSLLKMLVDLMLQYSFNNILHNLVRDIVTSVIAFGEGPLRDKSLMQEAKLPEAILKGFKEQEKKSAKNKADRMGYTAHLITFANALEETAVESKTMRAALDKVSGWQAFVESHLANENKRQDTTLGGRRPHTHLQDSDDEDLEQTMGSFDYMHNNNTASTGDVYDNNDDPFASTANDFNTEWEAQAQANGSLASAEKEFEEVAEGKINSTGDGEDYYDDPFATTTTTTTTGKPKAANNATSTEDDFADFDAEFDSISLSGAGTKSATPPASTASPTAPTVEKKEEQKKEKEDDFADFEAAFGDS